MSTVTHVPDPDLLKDRLQELLRELITDYEQLGKVAAGDDNFIEKLAKTLTAYIIGRSKYIQGPLFSKKPIILENLRFEFRPEWREKTDGAEMRRGYTMRLVEDLPGNRFDKEGLALGNFGENGASAMAAFVKTMEEGLREFKQWDVEENRWEPKMAEEAKKETAKKGSEKKTKKTEPEEEEHDA